MTVVSTAFETLARAEAQAMKMAGLPILVVPHPVGSRSPEELRAWGEGLVAGCIDALTTGPRS
jgi:hypothetical protein